MRHHFTLLTALIFLSTGVAFADEKTHEASAATIKTAPIINQKKSLGIPRQSDTDVTSSEATPVTDGEITSSEATPVTETEADLERRAQARRDHAERSNARAERRAQMRTEQNEEANARAERRAKNRTQNQTQVATPESEQVAETQQAEQLRHDIAETRTEQQTQMQNLNKK